MKTKIYIMFAMVIAGLTLAFNSLTEEKIKVSVVHHENGEVTILDTVFESSSGYTVEQFLSDHGFDPEKTEIVNTDSFEGKYVAEFKNEIKHDGNVQPIIIDVDVEENDGERVEIRRIVDKEGHVSAEKKVNGEVVELSDEELKDLAKNNEKHTSISRSFNSDKNGQEPQEVEIIEVVDGDGKTLEIKIEGGEFEFEGDGKNVMVIEEVEDENGETKVKTRIRTAEGKELKEVDMNWTEDKDKGKKVFITDGADGENVEIQVFIDRKDLEAGEILQEDVKAFKGPDGFTKEVIVVKSHSKLNTLTKVPIFLREEEALEPYTVAIVSKITEPENEPENENPSEPGISVFTTDNANLPIEDLKFFPNPTDGNFRMSFFLPQRGLTAITIYDANGKEVLKKDLGNFQGAWNSSIDLTNMESGTYILNITQNNLRLAEKIIVN